MKLTWRKWTRNFRGDLFGGLTSGVVSLPLALALGVASGAGAQAGIYSAVVTGALASIFGGVPAQITGPTPGMTAILIKVYKELGPQGLFAAMLLGGLVQFILSFCRVGKYIHFLPRPVVVGLTNGIAVLIFWNQFKDIFVPGGAMATLPMQVAAAGVVGLILIWPRITRAIPGSLVALPLSAVVVLLVGAPVRLLGALPSSLPTPSVPIGAFTLEAMPTLVQSGLLIALLGTIETLLSAVVLDDMTGTKHDSDKELFGQGLANLIAPLFGGLAGAGAIVRSAVNVRAGGRTPLAAVINSLFLAAVLLWLGPFIAYVPIPALWGVLIATSIGLVDWSSIRALTRTPISESLVMMTTTVLAVVQDLATGVAVGLALSFVFFTFHMSRIPVLRREEEGKVVLTLVGPLFFGVAKKFMEEVEAIPFGKPQVWDLSYVTSVDVTGATVIKQALAIAERQGSTVSIVGLQEEPKQLLTRMEVI